MDHNVEVVNGSHEKPVSVVCSDDIENHVKEDEHSATLALLPPKVSLITRIVQKPRRKVQWTDVNGNDLTEVLEFQPSESGYSDEEEDSCLCTIM